MRILLVSYLFPPLANPQAILSARFAKYLQRAGHHVVVLAGTNVPTFGSSHGLDPMLMSDLGAVDIHYVKDIPAKGIITELRKKLVNHEHYDYWVRESFKVALDIWRQGDLDVIYSLSAPTSSNVLGLQLRRRIGIPWVAHLSDPGYLALNIRFKSPLQTHITRATEIDILRNADGITFVNEETMLRTTAFDPTRRSKCLVLPHCFDPDYFPDQPPAELNCGDVISLSYVGSLYSRRAPFNVIRALERIVTPTGLSQRRLELHLYGGIEPEIRARLDKMGSNLVTVHGPVSYYASIQAMLSSDYLLLIDMPDEDNLYTPSKLIDYLGARRPIVGITSLKSNTARLLTELGYPVVAPGDLDGLTDLFNRLSLCKTLPVTLAHLQILDSYRADSMAGKLADFLSERANRGNDR